MLTEQTLRKGLKTHRFGSKIYSFDSIDSTNNCAKAIAACGATEGTVIIAEQQTAGKGRMGRPWQANPNENLTFSIVLRPQGSADAMNLLPLYVAVGVAEAIERTTGIQVECKWPNDLLINSKKVAGILIEGSLKQNALEYAVVGVGLNVNQKTFSGELEQKATSLYLASGKEIDRSVLFREILRSLEGRYRDASSGGFTSVLPEWLSRCRMINQEISVSLHGQVLSGVVKGLNNEGALILQANGTEKTLFAGDVTIIGR